MSKSPIILIAVAVAVALLILPIAQAADIELSDTCSLADAIVAANRDIALRGCASGDQADSIIFTSDVELDASLPVINSHITIEGSGYAVSGATQYRIFAVRSGRFIINNLLMTSGHAGDFGGTLASLEGSTVTINNSIIDSSWADEGGAIYHEGPVSIRNSTIVNNRAVLGGAIRNFGSILTIDGSHFWNNKAGCRNRIGTCDHYSGDGGAIYSRANSDIRITNSTFTGNSAPETGGAIFAFDNLSIVNSTFVGNTAETGGGIIMNRGLSPVILLQNNIVIDSKGGDCVGIRRGVSDNFISDGSCFADFSGDPRLGDLEQPEDGSPAYYPLLEDSLAIDTGQSCPSSDQIGTRRPQGTACDLGAVEYVSAEIIATAESRATERICIVTTTHSLNIRSEPNGRVIGGVPKNTILSTITYSDGWYQVDFNTALGWISADYVTGKGSCEHVSRG